MNVSNFELAVRRMSEELPDINQIRRRNLWILVERAGGIPEFADALEVSRQRIHVLMRPNAKANLGDELARRIEQVYGRPKNWMDHMHPEEQSIVADMLDQIEREETADPDKITAVIRTIWRTYNKKRAERLIMQESRQPNNAPVQNVKTPPTRRRGRRPRKST